jgi:hypothetical protein
MLQKVGVKIRNLLVSVDVLVSGGTIPGKVTEFVDTYYIKIFTYST